MQNVRHAPASDFPRASYGYWQELLERLIALPRGRVLIVDLPDVRQYDRVRNSLYHAARLKKLELSMARNGSRLYLARAEDVRAER